METGLHWKSSHSYKGMIPRHFSGRNLLTESDILNGMDSSLFEK